MTTSVWAAFRTIGRALDGANETASADLRLTLMTRTSYAERRDFAHTCAAAGRSRRERQALADADNWYRRLPPSVQWRDQEGKRTVRRRRSRDGVERETNSA